MEMKTPLCKQQREIMAEFYSIAPTRVVFNKRERNDLWAKAKKRENFDLSSIETRCPALAHRIRMSYDTGRNIQSAVFSECVYAQTFANMLRLCRFVNCTEQSGYIPPRITTLIKSYNLEPRYAYGNADKSRMLIQAGGCGGIDSALITVIDLTIYTIEFKKPGAKTGEHDLPKYEEDGRLRVLPEFQVKYPQFTAMLDEKQNLCFFDVMGSNVNAFSWQSINTAVSKSYSSHKFGADVVCTEDKNGFLVMLPSNQISSWARIEGEIRPSGRNHYAVWTPKALVKFLIDKGATIQDERVTIRKEALTLRKERGGGGRISGYKINPLFFVYKKDCVVLDSTVSFPFASVRQLNPTIAAKVFFRKLQYKTVKDYYATELDV